MPELPDLVYLEKKLQALLPGRTIRRVEVRQPVVLGHDAFFCPQCQPATRKQFIDWRKR